MEKGLELNIQEWDMFIARLKGNASKFNKFLQVAANTVGFADIIDHFSSETSPQGPWKELKRPRSGKILQLTGRLRGSVLPGAGGTEVMGQNAVRMFSNVEYSRTHDEGDESRNIPQREFMWLSDKAQQAMVNMMRDMLLKGT